MKLYEIMADYERLAEMDMDTDDDVSAFMELLHGVEGTFDQKAENYCKLIRNLESDADAFKVEKDRLAKKQKQVENRVNEIKKYLQFEASKIIVAGASRKVGTFTLSIRNNPEALEVVDESALTDEYLKVSIMPDTAKIKEALKNGETVEGCRLTRGTSLRIS